MSRIIVGIDGSAAATKAFEWAYDHAGGDDTLVVIFSEVARTWASRRQDRHSCLSMNYGKL